jgi:putative endonuclease
VACPWRLAARRWRWNPLSHSELPAHLLRGAAAEQLACEHLTRAGLRLVLRNYRCPAGELDLVMADGVDLAIVEVRCRSRDALVDGLESISAAKCRRIIRATEHLLQHGPGLAGSGVRFDIVVVSGDPPTADLEWLRAAFTADDVAGARGLRV